MKQPCWRRVPSPGEPIKFVSISGSWDSRFATIQPTCPGKKLENLKRFLLMRRHFACTHGRSAFYIHWTREKYRLKHQLPPGRMRIHCACDLRFVRKVWRCE